MQLTLTPECQNNRQRFPVSRDCTIEKLIAGLVPARLLSLQGGYVPNGK
jgi:hypothetical protein